LPEKTLKSRSHSEVRINKETIMRTILLSFVAAIVLLGAFSSCSTSVKTDSGHGVTAGVH